MEEIAYVTLSKLGVSVFARCHSISLQGKQAVRCSLNLSSSY